MIKLSKLTDYAVVVLAVMAQERGTVVSASALAEKTHLPEPTVAKVLKILSKHGIILSVRGTNGGYKLEKTADQIDMASVISAMDGPIALTACVDGSAGCCNLENSCPVKGQWDPVNMAMKQALGNVSLAQMIQTQR